MWSWFMVSSFLLGSVASAAGEGVTVQVTGLRNDKGKVGCLAWSSETGFPSDNKQASAGAMVSISGQQARCHFPQLSPGTYAISVMHDENGDGKLNTNMVGIPTEGYGFSNGARGTFGPPDFKAAVVQIASGTPAKVKVRY